jgi:hypothetical protein
MPLPSSLFLVLESTISLCSTTHLLREHTSTISSVVWLIPTAKQRQPHSSPPSQLQPRSLRILSPSFPLCVSSVSTCRCLLLSIGYSVSRGFHSFLSSGRSTLCVTNTPLHCRGVIASFRVFYVDVECPVHSQQSDNI